MKKKKRYIVLSIVAVIVIIIALVVSTISQIRKATEGTIATATAELGSIRSVVTGTGSLTDKATLFDVLIPSGVQIDDVLVDKGDIVKPGDVLATLDEAVLNTVIRDTQDELNTLAFQLERTKDAHDSQYVVSPASGRIKQVFIQEGASILDTMAEHSALMLVSLDGKMKVAFKPSSAAGLSESDDVTVTLSDGKEKDGEIASVSEDLCIVTLTDNGPALGEQVTVSKEDGTALGSGALEINAPVAITFTGGTAMDVLKDVGDTVSVGAKLIKLREAPLSREYEQLYQNYLDKKDALNALLTYSKTGSIVCTEGGTVDSVSVADGQTIGGAQSTAAQIAGLSIKTGGTIELKAQIDELDIPVIELGQPVEITLDAFPDKQYAGTVSAIADTGVTSQGSTTYDVSFEFPADDFLKSGMSASVTIIIDEKENIVKLPLSALQESGTEQYVYVGTAKGITELGQKQAVTTGLSDGEFVEIVSGLKAGDTVNYLDTTIASMLSSFSSMQQQNMGQAQSRLNPSISDE
ncbi:MAG: efflux RND transporter periplasmic adaptor subunit [Bacillota bacterium]